MYRCLALLLLRNRLCSFFLFRLEFRQYRLEPFHYFHEAASSKRPRAYSKPDRPKRLYRILDDHDAEVGIFDKIEDEGAISIMIAIFIYSFLFE